MIIEDDSPADRRPSTAGSHRVRTALVVVILACGAAAALLPVVRSPPAPVPAPAPPRATPDPATPVQRPDLDRRSARPEGGGPLVPVPHDRSVRLSPEQVQGLMVEAGFPPHAIGTGVALSNAESGRVPDSVNARARVGTDRGLWQVNDHYWGGELADRDWQDPAQNTRAAFAVWSESGWDAWVAYDADEMDGAPPPDPAALPHQVARVPTTDR